MDIEDLEHLSDGESLSGWIVDKVDDWGDHYNSNYSDLHSEYYRLFSGIWSAEDSLRKSERSRLISPALSQAVESSAAEIEEATFGRGPWFDVSDDVDDQDPSDIARLRAKLTEDFNRAKVRPAMSEVILTSAIYGTGIGEVCIEYRDHIVPATQPAAEGLLNEVGTITNEEILVTLKPVLPQNFRIDPLATSIDTSIGCAVDEFVTLDYVHQMQEMGIYEDVYVGTAAPDSDLEPDDELTSIWDDNRVRLTRYYGRVPSSLLKEDATTDVKIPDGDMVEAIVVIANGDTILKAEPTPYMMKDRPVVAFRWDKAPGRFWGRGVCEKGYMSQKALDTEMRARVDALALTIHPMLAMDARQIPRGFRPEIAPGKVILTNGDPRQTMQPFSFGAIDATSFQQSQSLQMMVQQATGAVDSAGMAGQINGEATASGISMSLGAIIKRHKRTLTMFQDEFLIPFVEKSAYRYMQFKPDEYQAKDYKFTADASLGIMAREYETMQLTQVMQTLPPGTPAHGIVLQSIIENMSIANREEIIQALQQAQQPDPQAQQAQQQAQQAEQQRMMELHQAQVQLLSAQAQDEFASAQKKMVEAQSIPVELEIEKIRAATTNLDDGVADDIEFKRRLEVTDRVLAEKKLDMEFQDKERERQFKAEQEQAKARQAQEEKAAKMQQMQAMIGQNKANTEGVSFG